MGWFSSLWILPTAIALVTLASQDGRNANFFSRINRSKRGGTSVTAKTAAMAMEKFLVKASGLNIRPSCASKVKTGRKETAITSKAKKLGPPTSLMAPMMTSLYRLAGLWLASVPVFVGLFHHHDRCVHHRANRDRQPAQRHDVGVQTHQVHRNKGEQESQRNRNNGNHGAWDVPEKYHDDQAHNDQFLDQSTL